MNSQSRAVQNFKRYKRIPYPYIGRHGERIAMFQGKGCIHQFLDYWEECANAVYGYEKFPWREEQ